MLSAFLFMICQFATSVCGLKFAIFWGQLSFFVQLVLCVVWLMLTFLIADFCVSPMDNIYKATLPNEVKNITMYYSTCSGTNILNSYLMKAKQNAILMNNSINSLLYNPSSTCKNDHSLQMISIDLQSVFQTFISIDNDIACSPINHQWWEFIETGLCKNLYYGFSALWISQITTSILLFILIVASSVSYQYFDPRITLPNQNQEIYPTAPMHPFSNHYV